MMSALDLMLWAVLPYLVIATFVGGTVWRYRHDRFGWTSRSSQLHESRLLAIGNPLFHCGLFMVIGGHVMGLLVPKALTELVGITEENYHLVSLGMGTLSGAAALIGLAILLYRRVRTTAVRVATTRTDVLTFVVLGCAMLAGMMTTVVDNGVRGGYDYRETISPWFRDLFLLHPHPELMTHAPFDYQLHILLGMFLFAVWPFTRLVHAFSAPLHYLFRPYLVYRSRNGERIGTRSAQRGWEGRAWDSPPPRVEVPPVRER